MPNRAVRDVAIVFGILAGALGFQHGLFEMLQGNVAPSGPFIHAFGPPCQPDAAWHACEPAVSLVPSYLVGGLLAMLAGAAVVAWAVLLPRGRRGTAGLLVLVGALFGVGGGFMPLLFGLLAALAAALVESPLAWWRAHLSPGAAGFLALSWPWTLAALLLYEVLAWTVGTAANDTMLALTPVATALEPVVLAWIFAAAFAHDLRRGAAEPSGR